MAQQRTAAAVRCLRDAGYLVAAGIAAVISWRTIAQAARDYLGLPGWLAYAYPAVVDAPLVTLSATAWLDRQQHRRTGLSTWLLLAGYVLLSAAFNMAAHSEVASELRERWAGVVTLVMASLPPVSAFLAFERAASSAAGHTWRAADGHAADTRAGHPADGHPADTHAGHPADTRAARRADTTAARRPPQRGVRTPARERLQAAYGSGVRPDGQPWTVRSLAAAAGTGRTAAATFLREHARPENGHHEPVRELVAASLADTPEQVSTSPGGERS